VKLIVTHLVKFARLTILHILLHWLQGPTHGFCPERKELLHIFKMCGFKIQFLIVGLSVSRFIKLCFLVLSELLHTCNILRCLVVDFITWKIFVKDMGTKLRVPLLCSFSSSSVTFSEFPKILFSTLFSEISRFFL
jgi:hypothetical protein